MPSGWYLLPGRAHDRLAAPPDHLPSLIALPHNTCRGPCPAPSHIHSSHTDRSTVVPCQATSAWYWWAWIVCPASSAADPSHAATHTSDAAFSRTVDSDP